jgi:hypothetical protein
LHINNNCVDDVKDDKFYNINDINNELKTSIINDINKNVHIFAQKSAQNSVQNSALYNCALCGKFFTRASSINRHLLENCKMNKEGIDNKINKNIKQKTNKKFKKEVDEDFDKEVDKDYSKDFSRDYEKGFDKDFNKECKEISERVNKEELAEVLKIQQEQIRNLTKIIMTLKEGKNNSLNLTTNNTIDDNSINTNNINNTKINNQINNKMNNITNNNIKIEFGKEDLSKISNDFFIKTLVNSSGALIPSKIIEGIHFNPELKEFMNVFISDFSRNKAMIYDGKSWNIANADEIVNTLFDKAIIFCEDRNEELYDKIQKNEKIKKKINKEMYIMDIMNNNEPYEYNEYKEPVDIDGNVLVLSELKRGKSLNGKAKEHLKKSLYNKKRIVVK